MTRVRALLIPVLLLAAVVTTAGVEAQPAKRSATTARSARPSSTKASTKTSAKSSASRRSSTRKVASAKRGSTRRSIATRKPTKRFAVKRFSSNRSSTNRRTVASAVVAMGERPVNVRGPFSRISEGERDGIAEASRALLGVRYTWAGATPERGVDCSGLVQYVFGQLGVRLPRTAHGLASVGSSVEFDTAAMKIGDLLVFSRRKSARISHVGIYVGDGKMVHASSVRKSVVEVPLSKYTGMQLRGVRRVVDVASAATADSVPDQR